MGFSRQRENSRFVVKSEQKILHNLINYFFTIIMWIYSCLAIFLFLSAIFDYNNEFLFLIKIVIKVDNSYVKSFLIFCLIYFLLALILLYVWRTYNKVKFGSLNRRKYPLPATKEDILALGLIDEEDYLKLQNSKVVVFEKNPIKDIANKGEN